MIMMLYLFVMALIVDAASASNILAEDSKPSSNSDGVLTTIQRLERSVSMMSRRLQAIESRQGRSENIRHVPATYHGRGIQDKLVNIIRTLTTDVAYSVSLQSDINQVRYKPLIFDTVLYNQGDAYNKTAGKFTAPVSGTYMFWANVMVRSSAYSGLRIYRGSTMIARGFITGQVHGVASITTTTHLNAGEQVWMDVYARATTIPLRGEACSSYGGTLIHVT